MKAITDEQFHDLMREWEECEDEDRKDELSKVIGAYRQTGQCGIFLGEIELLNQKTNKAETCIQVLRLGEIDDDWGYSPDGVSFIFDSFIIWPDDHFDEIDGCYWGYVSAFDAACAEAGDLTQMWDVSEESWFGQVETMLYNPSIPFSYSFLKGKLEGLK